MKSFNPKFDVKELKEEYQLHGELPVLSKRMLRSSSPTPILSPLRVAPNALTLCTPPTEAIEGNKQLLLSRVITMLPLKTKAPRPPLPHKGAAKAEQPKEPKPNFGSQNVALVNQPVFQLPRPC